MSGGQTAAGPFAQCWAILLGFAFPLHFLQSASGLGYYLDGEQQFLCYAAGYACYGVVGAGLGLAALVMQRAVAQLWPAVGTRLAGWIGCTLMLAVLGWVVRNSFGSGFALERGAKLAIGALVLAAAWPLSRSAVYGSALQFSRIVAGAGALMLPVAVLLAVMSAPGAAQAGGPRGTGPLAIWVSFDAYSAVHSSAYGYARDTTPALTSFARDALLFERSYSNSNFTTSGFASLLRSQRPWTHRQLHLYSRGHADGRSLLEALAGHGYRNYVSVSNTVAAPLHHGLEGAVAEETPSATAFLLNDLVRPVERLGLNPGFMTIGWLPRLIALSDHCAREPAPGRQADPAPQFAWALATLAREGGPGTFLWVHVLPPHDPYVSPPGYLGTFDPSERGRRLGDSSPRLQWRAGEHAGEFEGRYDEDMRFVDAEFGKFLDGLRAAGLYDQAFIFVNADHGESFHFGYGAHSGPFLSEELIRVPFLVKLPNGALTGRSDVVVEQVDFAPTLLGALGIPAPAGLEGRALLARNGDGRWTVAAEPHPAFSMNFEQSRDGAELANGVVAMVDGTWKYVAYRGRHDFPERPALADGLYDLAADPSGATDVSAEHPERARAMRSVLERELAAHAR